MRHPRPTLLEVCTGLLAVGVALTYVAPARFRVGGNREMIARAELNAMGSALEGYRYDVGAYPGTAPGLRALVDSAGQRSPYWDGPYLLRFDPVDPWGHPYVYRASGAPGASGYVLLSFGADGRPGGRGVDADIGDSVSSR